MDTHQEVPTLEEQKEEIRYKLRLIREYYPEVTIGYDNDSSLEDLIRIYHITVARVKKEEDIWCHKATSKMLKIIIAGYSHLQLQESELAKLFGGKLPAAGVTISNFFDMMNIIADTYQCDPDNEISKQATIAKLDAMGISYAKVLEAITFKSIL
jgi:hypothetical protein